jgi:putative membrane protein (TIGR04086 family)
MSDDRKIDFKLIIVTALVLLLSTVGAMFIFAAVMYFLEKGYEYSPLFATVSVAVGSFLGSLYLGAKIQQKGILIGLSLGGSVFLLVTLITLAVNSGAIDMHIFLRFIIILLASLIGAILGVNRNSNPKYI